MSVQILESGDDGVLDAASEEATRASSQMSITSTMNYSHLRHITTPDNNNSNNNKNETPKKEEETPQLRYNDRLLSETRRSTSSVQLTTEKTPATPSSPEVADILLANKMYLYPFDLMSDVSHTPDPITDRYNNNNNNNNHHHHHHHHHHHNRNEDIPNMITESRSSAMGPPRTAGESPCAVDLAGISIDGVRVSSTVANSRAVSLASLMDHVLLSEDEEEEDNNNDNNNNSNNDSNNNDNNNNDNDNAMERKNSLSERRLKPLPELPTRYGAYLAKPRSALVPASKQKMQHFQQLHQLRLQQQQQQQQHRRLSQQRETLMDIQSQIKQKKQRGLSPLHQLQKEKEKEKEELPILSSAGYAQGRPRRNYDFMAMQRSQLRAQKVPREWNVASAHAQQQRQF
ncbi:hypothetical protein LSM04_005267 [Trypanosoma melophagium]|uniref:uncharacterized protein n=1 Tax=Trypanosoma melophagium TaxID=715481 RepID=UPI00351A4FA4|nr:hypothetical protein LSM04_005267 [Trypanosoma melophagium]